MLSTREVLSVPAAQRPGLVGSTAYKWGGSVGDGVELTYSFATIGSAFPADYPPQYLGDIRVVPDNVKAAFQAALQAWANVAKVTFQEVADSGASYGDIRIGVSASNPNFPLVLAEAAPPAFPNGSLAGDVWIAPQPEAGLGWYLTALHELGHAVFDLGDVSMAPGLNGAILPAAENYRGQTIMSYSDLPGATVGDSPINQGALHYPTTPMVLDVLVAQWLYGANIGYHAEDDNYSFSEAATSYMTIWDGGGNDTISIAANAKAGVLDLTPGHYSDVGSVVATSAGASPTTLTKTVGIAFGAVIENAVGGSAGDTIIGNVASNVLRGNGGNDFIDGGAGVDTSVYSHSSNAYKLVVATGSVSVQDRLGTDGTDTLVDVELVQFADRTIDTTWFSKAAGVPPSQFADLTDMYIAYFDRAPDAAGLFYWASRLKEGMTLQQIAKSFFVQPETIAGYPPGQSTTDFVTKVYANVLGRDPDQGGLHYWIDSLQSGGVSKDEFMLAIVYGARAASGNPADAQYLANKNAVGRDFAVTEGLSNVAWAKTLMAGVDGTLASVQAAYETTDGFAATAATPNSSELVVQLIGVVV